MLTSKHGITRNKVSPPPKKKKKKLTQVEIITFLFLLLFLESFLTIFKFYINLNTIEMTAIVHKKENKRIMIKQNG